MEPLRVALAAVVAGEQATEDLPDVAADALVRGLDTPALRALAGTTRRDVREARDLFLQAIDELGWPTPSEDEALNTLAHHWSAEMVEGRLRPYDAASLIWWTSANRLGKPEHLLEFVALASEWQDHPDLRPELEVAMLSAALKLLQRGRA